MVCIKNELTQMGQYPSNDKPYIQNETDSSSAERPCQSHWPPGSGFGQSGKTNGFFDNLMGCMRPLIASLIEKSSVIEMTNKMEQWEIPFESITDLEWLGSGAQGTVFSGKLKNEIVAVKKVRDLKETDIKHLRKLDHENIIKFK